jgi:hypothetical protein
MGSSIWENRLPRGDVWRAESKNGRTPWASTEDSIRSQRNILFPHIHILEAGGKTTETGELQEGGFQGSAAAAAGTVGMARLALARVATTMADEGAGFDVLRFGHLHAAGCHRAGQFPPEPPAASRGGIPPAGNVGAESEEGFDAVGASAMRGRGERGEPHQVHRTACVLQIQRWLIYTTMDCINIRNENGSRHTILFGLQTNVGRLNS